MEGIVKLIASTTMKRGEVGILVDGSGPNGTVGRVYKNTGGSHKYGGQRVMALDNCFPSEKSRFSYLDDLVTYIGVPSGGKRGNPVYIDEDAGLLSLSLPTNGVFVGDIAHGNVARLQAAGSAGSAGSTVYTLTHLDSDDPGDIALGVWGDGTFIYLANYGGGLHVYSVDGAGTLTHVDSDDPGDYSRSVWGDGSFIYLASGGEGLHVYSVDGSGVLTHIGSDDPGDSAFGVWGDGTFIYLANYGGGLCVYSVNPSGVLSKIDSDDPGGSAFSVWGDGTFIYLANYSEGLHVYSYHC